MPNLVALGLMVSDKKIFKDLKKKLSFVAMATRVFERIKLFQDILQKNLVLDSSIDYENYKDSNHNINSRKL